MRKNCVLFEGGMHGLGITFHMSHLACEIKKLFSDVYVLWDGTEQEEGLNISLEKCGVKCFNYSTDSIDYILNSLSKEYDFIIFHAESYGGARRISRYKKKYNIHIILTMNAYRYAKWYAKYVCKWIKIRYSPCVDSWVFMSQKSRDEFCSYANVFNSSWVIPWGVEKMDDIKKAESFYDIYDEKFHPYDDEVKYIIYAAQFHKHKSHKFLIDALMPILKNNNVELVFGGDGLLMDDIHRYIVSKGLLGKVHFLGRVKRSLFMSHMKRAFLSIVLSKNETFGHNILEPLQLGIPVISTGTGIAPEIIFDFYNGFIVRKDDQQRIRELTEKIYKGNINIASCYQDMYSWPRCASLYVKLYQYIATK